MLGWTSRRSSEERITTGNFCDLSPFYTQKSYRGLGFARGHVVDRFAKIDGVGGLTEVVSIGPTCFVSLGAEKDERQETLEQVDRPIFPRTESVKILSCTGVNEVIHLLRSLVSEQFAVVAVWRDRNGSGADAVHRWVGWFGALVVPGEFGASARERHDACSARPLCTDRVGASFQNMEGRMSERGCSTSIHPFRSGVKSVHANGKIVVRFSLLRISVLRQSCEDRGWRWKLMVRCVVTREWASKAL